MNKIYTLCLIIAIIGFQGCGGGGGSSDTATSTSIQITVECVTSDLETPSIEDISTYHELFSGDEIIKDEENSIVQIHTSIDSNSRVCLQSGSAHIKRD